ncbi:histone demethylation 1 [Fusarium albosuccineum]|uniref:Histone demethylation 1 n=1 Tax=Fusarium albosuccineum TaxID=1237068 RepID=A0A8H4PBR2_9HYPO|nr:histone demethylation 1 [Fusarium albosuccineum]
MSKQFLCIYCSRHVGRANRTRHLLTHNADPDETALIEKFLHDLKDHQSLLADALESEIKRAGGLRSLEDKKHRDAWGRSKSDSPFLMNISECWKGEVTDQHVFEDIMHDFNKDKHVVISTTELHHPEQETSFAEVIEQIFVPNLSRVVFAVNFRIRDAMFQPQRLQHHKRFSEPLTTANATPLGSFVDSHIDRGYHGITALKHSIKIWGLYPLTAVNRKAWEQHRKSSQRFIDLQGKLEEGRFFVQSPSSAIYIPPGSIHTTVTVKGGYVPGILYITHESLEAAAHDLDIDISCGMSRKAAEFQPFLESVIMCFKEGESRCEAALKTLCKLSKQPELRKNKLFDEVKKYVDGKSSCGVCKNKWASHWRR